MEEYDIKDCYEGRFNNKYQFFFVGYELIESNKISKPNIRLYLFLRRYVRKIRSKYDPLQIFERFYANGLLATSWTVKELAKRLCVSKDTIKRWVKELVAVGAMRIEKVVYNGTRQNVYVLGEIDEKKEIYYYEQPRV